MSAAPQRPAPGGIAGVVLAAGAGQRLAPLTAERPKALCPVGNEALLDRSVAAIRAAVRAVAVNVHHGRAAMVDHLDGFEASLGFSADPGVADAEPWLHVSIEAERALGTAGALGHLRPWLAGRAALVVNADAWTAPDLRAFVQDWDYERVRILVVGTEPFGPRSRIVASLMPWSEVKGFAAEPSGLYERSWRDRAHEGAVETCVYDGPFVDCGTPASYLAANLLAVTVREQESIVAPGALVDTTATIADSVIGAGAEVAGDISSCVLWPGARVVAGESLARAIRTAGGRTVLVR